MKKPMRVNCPNFSDLQKIYCDCESKAFLCRDKYGCDIACPFNRWWKFIEAVTTGASPEVAHEQTLRQSIDEDTARKIIADSIKR
jgi:hypothetical protein